MKSNKKNYIIAAIGILIFAGGVILIIAIDNPEGILKTLPYICIGIGSGAIGQGISEIVNLNTIKKNPKLAKRISIEQNDERNILIKNRAKAKTYDLIMIILPVLMLSTVLVNLDLLIVLLLVCAYLGFIAYNVYYFLKYNKEM